MWLHWWRTQTAAKKGVAASPGADILPLECSAQWWAVSRSKTRFMAWEQFLRTLISFMAECLACHTASVPSSFVGWVGADLSNVNMLPSIHGKARLDPSRGGEMAREACLTSDGHDASPAHTIWSWKSLENNDFEWTSAGQDFRSESLFYSERKGPECRRKGISRTPLLIGKAHQKVVLRKGGVI